MEIVRVLLMFCERKRGDWMFLTTRDRIPDVSAYLVRIGIKDEGGDGRPAPSLDFLNDLIYRHQCSVPFENLEIYDDKAVPSLKIEDLYDKVVRRNRGGYCFELNALFYSLLVELGFDAYPCMTQEWETEPLPPLHQATIVRLDGELFYCDVGFGGPVPAGAFRIEDGATETFYGDTFTFEKVDDWYWLLSRIKRSKSAEEKDMPLVKEKLMTVCLFPQQEVMFITPNYYCATVDAFFTEQRLANLKTKDGYVSITNMCFKKRVGSEVYSKELESLEELRRVLKEYFSIEV